MLLTTSAQAALDDPGITVVLVCCTAVQSVISRLRSLVVALLKKRVESVLTAGGDLDRLLPRASSLLRTEMSGGVNDVLRANVQQSIDEEAAATLQQICVVHLVDVWTVVLFLRKLSSVLDEGLESVSEGAPAPMGDIQGVAGEDALVSAAAVEVELSATASHAQDAAIRVGLDIQRRAGGVGQILLLVDGLGSVLGAAQSGQAGHQSGHALLAAVGGSLHALARGHDAAVVVSNTVVVDRMPGVSGTSSSLVGPNVKPALGVSWAAVPDTRFLLTPMRRLASLGIEQGSSSSAPAASVERSGGLVKVYTLKIRDGVSKLEPNGFLRPFCYLDERVPSRLCHGCVDCRLPLPLSSTTYPSQSFHDDFQCFVGNFHFAVEAC